MKYKLLIPFALILFIIGFWFYNFAGEGISITERDISKSMQYYIQGKYDEAILKLNKVLEKEPNNIEGKLLLADIFIARADYTKGILQYKEILNIDENNEQALTNLINIYYKEKNYEEIYLLLEKYKDSEFLKNNRPSPPTSNKEYKIYENTIDVLLKSKEDYKILYTLDNSEPNFSSIEYKENIYLGKGNHIIKTVSEKNGILSEVAIFEYEIKNDYSIIHFNNKTLENNLREELNNNLNNITNKDLDNIKSILILGEEIYYNVENFELEFEYTDLGNKLKKVSITRNNNTTEYYQIPNGDIGNLEDLEYFANIETLYICSEDNLDLSFLKKIKNLKNLNISNIVNIKKIEEIQNLKNLESLDLINNNIENILFLENMYSLVELNLSHNKINDISILENLKNLKNINLNYNNINNINPILGILNLKRLEFLNNPVESIEGIEGLEKLEYIDY